VSRLSSARRQGRARRLAVTALVGIALSALVGCGAEPVRPSPSPEITRSPSPAASAPTASPTVTPAPAPIEPPAAIFPPSSTPTQVGLPALSELVLTPDGLGDLVVGEPIDSPLLTWDAHGCMTPEQESQRQYYADDDPVWATYVPNYTEAVYVRDGYSYSTPPFHVYDTEDGRLRWLRVAVPDIATDRGIRIGATEEEVQAAYPDAVRFDKAAGWYTTYNVDGSSGRLVIEIANQDFSADGPREVWTMMLTEPDGRLWSIGGGDAGGYCAIGV
jgi:hypothetical protein